MKRNQIQLELMQTIWYTVGHLKDYFRILIRIWQNNLETSEGLFSYSFKDMAEQFGDTGTDFEDYNMVNSFCSLFSLGIAPAVCVLCVFWT